MRRRRKGTGTLVRRGRVWYARWTENGVTRSVTTGETSREKAEEKLMELTETVRLRSREHALAVIERELTDTRKLIADAMEKVKPGTRVGELAVLFEKSPRRPDCARRQIEHYLGKIREFAANVGPETPVAEVDDAMAARHATWAAARFSPNSYNKVLDALALCWRTVGREAGATDNPWVKDRLPRKRLDTHSRTALTDEQIGAIMDAAECADDETRLLIVIGINTGLRLGDAVNVKWSDFSGDGLYLHCEHTRKTGAFVTIPVLPELADFLRPTAHAGETGPVLPVLAAKYRTDPCSVVDLVAEVFKRAGIETSYRPDGKKRARPSAGFHSFRHTFVTRAIEAGVPTGIVQAVVGHATTAMTEHYTHVSAEAIRHAFGKIVEAGRRAGADKGDGGDRP